MKIAIFFLTAFSLLAQNIDYARIRNGPGLSVIKYGADNTGVLSSTSAILSAISAAPANNCLILFPAGTYRVGSLGTISKACTFDFGTSVIEPDTTGVFITTSAVNNGAPFIFKNGTFSQYASVVPTDLFKLIDQPNTKFENVNFYRVQTSHSIIWNYATYGTKIVGGYWNFNIAPDLIRLAFAAAGDFSTFTYSFSMYQVDMSNTTGRCLGIEGGEITIDASVIESCSLGGIEHIGGFWYIEFLNISGTHFETNSLFNLQFPVASGNINAPILANVKLLGNSFINNPGARIALVGEVTNIEMDNNTIQGACLDNRFPTTLGNIIANNNFITSVGSGCSAATGGIATSVLAGKTTISGARFDAATLLSKVFYIGAPVYASNALAIAGGLQVGDIYRNGDLLQIVH